MAITISNSMPIVVTGTKASLRVTIEDTTGATPVPADPYSLKLDIFDSNQTPFKSFDKNDPSSRIVHDDVGIYHFTIGDVNPNDETDCIKEYLFRWTVMLTSASEEAYETQTVRVVSPKAMLLIPELKLAIDKSRKIVNEDPNEPCFLGYTESQLYTYLLEGISIINNYQPTAIFTIESYPIAQFRYILIQAAMVAAVMSQQLYAIDTDIPNYTDNGTTFVISHQPQLASVLNQITQWLDKQIPLMKLNFVRSGSLHVQQTGSFRLNALLSAAPNGALFRNIFFSG